MEARKGKFLGKKYIFVEGEGLNLTFRIDTDGDLEFKGQSSGAWDQAFSSNFNATDRGCSKEKFEAAVEAAEKLI